MSKKFEYEYVPIEISKLSENASFKFQNILYRVTSKKLPVPIVINQDVEVPLIGAHIAETKNAYKHAYFTPDTIVRILTKK